MGYRDDFYIIDNIVGITGPVDALPSVYFKNASTGEYGHITQVHKSDWNQGRTDVRTDKGYTINNTCGGGCTCGKVTSHEYRGDGHCFHHSRSEFVPIGNLSVDDRAVVAQAIWRCQDQKTDPKNRTGRQQEQARYDQLWNDVHENRTDSRGRRRAINYTELGLSNKVLKVAYPSRV